MTTSTPIPAVDTAPSMANPSDTASEAPPAQARAATVARPSLRAQAAENPLLSFFGLVIVALLAAAVAGPNIRISDTNGRIDRLEAKMDARFSDFEAKVDARFSDFEAKVDARFSALETAVGEIDLKLTALIAHLDATRAVDNALTGRLTGDGPVTQPADGRAWRVTDRGR